MGLTPLAVYECGSGSCPTVFTDAGHDDLVVQGWVAGPQVAEGVPAGELRVVLPRETLIKAVRRLVETKG